MHLVGVSTGGSIAQAFAVDQPLLLNRLVLLCSACRLSRTAGRSSGDSPT